MAHDIGFMLHQLGYSPNHIRNYIRRWRLIDMHNCEVCGKPDNEKPMAFRNMPWCSENHRKVVQKDDSVRKTF